jgi:hypothetical protein
MSIIDSNRFMKDVGAVEVDAKQHEVMPGIKEAQAKGGAKSGLNSSATVDPNVKAVVGADGKGIVNVTVVAPKEQDPKNNKPAASKPATQPVAPSMGTIGSGTVGSVGVTPTPVIGAPAKKPLLSRGLGRGLVARPNTSLAAKPDPTNLAPVTTNTAQALTAKANAPRPDTKTKAKTKAPSDGQVETKQVAVSINLQETRREKIMHLIQGGNLSPDVNAPKNQLQPHVGMKPDYRNKMGVGGRSPADAAKKLDNGAPQIDVAGMKKPAPAADAPKPATTQRITPPTAKLAKTPGTAPSPFSQ